MMESGRSAAGTGTPLQRVRLQFHSPDFDLGPLQRTWLLVPPSAREVNDLAWLICDKFKLKKQWQEGAASPSCLSVCTTAILTECSGILLEMEGFALPLTDPIEILRDNDTITYI